LGIIIQGIAGNIDIWHNNLNLVLINKNKMEKQNSEIKVLDLGAAAFLLCFNFRLIRLEPTGKPRQRAFVFDRMPPSNVLDFCNDGYALVKAYEYRTIHEGLKLMFEPSDLFAKITWLKKLLHDDTINNDTKPNEHLA
jgi:hypothetical protein